MTTGIVILNYNNYSDTINCIESIFKHCDKRHFLITIIDNFSQNDSVAHIKNYFKNKNIELTILKEKNNQKKYSQYSLIAIQRNLGYAKGNNVGIKFLIKKNVDSILILNNDILFKNNVLNELSETLNRHPEIGLLSPLLSKPDGTIDYNCCRERPSLLILFFESLNFFKLKFIKRFIDKKYILKSHPELIDSDLITCDIVSGACIMAKRKTWELLNGFDPNTFLYYEENILFEKIKNLKLKTAILTNVTAIHLGAKSTKEIKNTFLLSIELKSLRYYLKTYRNLNAISTFFITIARHIQISLVNLNNQMKGEKNNN